MISPPKSLKKKKTEQEWNEENYTAIEK